MIRVIDKNDTGKTRKLLEECSKNNGIFICKHPEKVTDKCKAYGLPPVTAIGYDKIYVGLADTPIYIDELEEHMIYNCPKLAGYTITVD